MINHVANSHLFLHITHDLSHDILYAFLSVINLICHFYISSESSYDDDGKTKRKRRAEDGDDEEEAEASGWVERERENFSQVGTQNIHHVDESSQSLPHYLSET